MPTSTAQKIVLATGNQGKVAELSHILAPFGHEIIPQTSLQVTDAEETGLTFIENALLKARHACSITGLPAIADDSGLSVRALAGAPGIYSARYAGPKASDADNIQLLLEKMQQVPAGQRQAEFHCVLVFLRHAADPTPLVSYGRWAGELTWDIQGEQGFGYDPIFWIPELGCTAAQLTKAEKLKISHRGQALRQLEELWRQTFPIGDVLCR